MPGVGDWTGESVNLAAWGTPVVMEQFCILIGEVVTQSYMGNKIAQNYVHTYTNEGL